MKQTQVSLSELSLELGVNKSLLLYYSQLGLIKAVSTIGRMKIFDRKSTLDTIKKISQWKKEGKTLREMIQRMADKK